MRSLGKTLFLVATIATLGLWLSRPSSLVTDALSKLTSNAERGAMVYAAMGCSSCHMAPRTDDPLVLAGGQPFKTDFGTFYAPNISTDPVYGIGGWSDLEIATAVTQGTSPEGRHYYPVFPYASYIRADLQDIVDLIAYLRTLPAAPNQNTPHDVGFPFNIRTTLGGWKLLFLKPGHVVTGNLTPEQIRGRYLVEALGHCGECHTPRNVLGGADLGQWLAGAPNPSGDGRIPDIRPTTLGWSAADITSYLETGLTPDYDSAGGEMVAVIKNTSQLTDKDRAAIAAYLLLPNQ